MSLIPSEHELHAYVDERLDSERRRAVELYLAANPEQAARVEAWRNDARQLRAALSGFAAQAPNPRLDPANVRRELRRRRQRRWASAAVLLLTLGIGGLGGWQVREASLLASNPPMADAVQAHRLFADAKALDLSAQDPARLQAWLGEHFAHVGTLPDLSAYGFTPLGARLLSNEQGPAALLLFEDARGQRVSLFLRSPGEHYARMPSGERTDGQLQARYWSRGDYNYALVSAASDRRGEQLRQALGITL
ncbi:anti-sigma factor family protein [Pseudomonas donghuensis]|uniref:anti-sigma factor family protein n=1 Tax=Pseudomonas donghuensis TaxID=1163398 RepID=UPI000C29C656|nr:anti-sigma factor [Pseudomonas donghuensis]PJY96662.1 anti-sigma factor [Pseudomonas donghuensis]WKY26470.1 anti-sigma factor [Pseudomonas donghuensis]